MIPKDRIRKWNIFVCIIVIVVLVLVIVNSGFFTDEAKLARYIDRHSVTVYESQGGFGERKYKDIKISNSEIMGIGHDGSSFILYSQTECTLTYEIIKEEYVVTCEIMFDWDDLESREISARVCFMDKRYLHSSDVVAWVEFNKITTGSNRPKFVSMNLVKNRTVGDDSYIRSYSSLLAHELLWEINDYLKVQSLPTLY